MSATKVKAKKRTWTAAQLRSMPASQRDAILEAAAKLAAKEYATNSELTDFEAFGEKDLYGHSSDTESNSR
jgi:hypothetical protein